MMTARCPDCKGSGEYIGARVVEPCAKCNGRGELNPDGTPLNLPKWMDDYKDQIKFNPKASSGWYNNKNPDLTVEELEQLLKDNFTKHPLLPELQISDIIHVYDAGWYEAEVVSIDLSGEIMARSAHNIFMWSGVHQLNYNLTQNRWEYIRAGTPVYP